jgi:crotonobetainyl-CoA:carnitine CoA-transferase CaiB-like acyl-CoA transferase
VDWLLALGDVCDEMRVALLVLSCDEAHTNPGRVAIRERLITAMQLLIRTADADRWQAACDKHRVPCCPINSVAEAFELPQTAATDMVQTVQHATIGELRMAGHAVKFSRW